MYIHTYVPLLDENSDRRSMFFQTAVAAGYGKAVPQRLSVRFGIHVLVFGLGGFLIIIIIIIIPTQERRKKAKLPGWPGSLVLY